MTIAKVDIVSNIEGKGLQPSGEVAQRAVASGGLAVNSYRPFIHTDGRAYVNQFVNGKESAVLCTNQNMPIKANAALRRDEWIELDRAVLKIARERLTGADDLTSRGLVHNLTNAMGKTVFEYEDMDDPGEAFMNMDPTIVGADDAPKFSTKYLPIPIIYGNFTVSERKLQASRNQGESIDTLMVEAVTRRIMEKLDDLFFTDTTYTDGGGTIYSYLNHTGVNTVTLATDWDASSKTGAEIKDDVLNMIQSLVNANHFGPYILYIPKAYQTVLGDDYTTGYPKTIRSRLMELEEISAIKVVDRLAADTVLLVQLTSDVVRLIMGFTPKIIQWDTQGGMVHNFKIMTIQVPQIRADQDSNSGICVLS